MRILSAAALALLFGLSGAPGARAQDWNLSTGLDNVAVGDVEALDGENVWAVMASLYGQGKIYRFDGGSWSLQTTVFSVQTAELTRLAAHDPARVWAVGNTVGSVHDGLIYFYDGDSWSLQTSIPDILWFNDVYAADADNVWAVGDQIYRTADGGATWSFSTAPAYSWFGVDGVDAAHVWAIGGPYNGPEQVLFFNGDSWSLQYEIDWGPHTSLRTIYAISPHDVWAGGDDGYLLHYDGTAWSVFTQITDPFYGDPVNIRALAALSANRIWAAGAYGYVFYFDGSGWNYETDLSHTSLTSLGVSPEEAWAGDEGGKIYHRAVFPIVSPRVGDYDGDGTSDIALFRPSSGLWLIRGLTRVYFGSSTDEVVPRDYSGNGAWDFAVYRPSLGKWMVRGLTSAFYGVATDITVPGDYDGDGSADIALFRPGIGKWLVRDGAQVYYGFASDTTVPGDYNGDGTTDIAVFRPSIGKWLVRNGAQIFYGNASDTVVPGDYTGDGSWDTAVFRPSAGRWLVKDGPNAYWGTSADTVQPGDYNGDGTLDFAVYRPSVGRWLVRGVTSVYYGASTDQPVTNP